MIPNYYSLRKAGNNGPRSATHAASQLHASPLAANAASNATIPNPSWASRTGPTAIIAAATPVPTPNATNNQCSLTTSRRNAARDTVVVADEPVKADAAAAPPS